MALASGHRLDQSVRMATKAPIRDRPVAAFPVPHVVHADRVVGVLGNLFVNVDHDQRQDHFLGVDLVDGSLALDEMGWWIAVRAPLADVRELLGEEALAHLPLPPSYQ